MDTLDLEQVKQYVLHRLETELSPKLLYHGVSHTRDDVVPAVNTLANLEGINGASYYLLLTAAWFHDLGFIEVQTGHEAVGARIASEVLSNLGQNPEQIQIVKNIIMVTMLPQSPNTNLERIMADADLEVLGRDDFLFRNDNLRRELAFFGQEYTDSEWYLGQLKFVESHSYFTDSARKLWNSGKAKNAINLRNKLAEIK